MAGALTTLTTDASRGLLDATSRSVVVYHEVDFLADAANGAFNSYPIPSNVSGELQDIGIAIGSPAPNTVDVLITDGFGLTVYAQTGITASQLRGALPSIIPLAKGGTIALSNNTTHGAKVKIILFFLV